MTAKRKLNLTQLTLPDVICPICLSILIEPVTMPCTHSLCMPCFKQHVAETSLECPMCRLRISVWVRRNTKSNRLVNNRLWQIIRGKFPEKIQARLEGKDDLDDEELPIPEPRVCAPGEIRQEFEALIQQEQQELASRRSQEEEASNQLILMLQEEEKMKLRQRRAQEEQLYQEDEILAQRIKEDEKLVLEQKMKEIQLICGSDEELARQIEKEEKSKVKHSTKVVVTPAKGPMDMYVGQKTPRSQGKLLLPDMIPHSSKMSSIITTDNYTMFPRPSYDTLDTPSTSNSSYNNHRDRNNFGAVNYKHPVKSNSSSDLKYGRSLREITSSQSSESESEDLPLAAVVKKNCITSEGKENVSLEIGSANVSLDYSLLFSGENQTSDIEKLKAEQLEIEERLRQEELDRKYAEQLQRQLDKSSQVDRSRGSEDEYVLRNRRTDIKALNSTKYPISPHGKRKRQTTLTEVMTKRQKRS